MKNTIRLISIILITILIMCGCSKQDTVKNEPSDLAFDSIINDGDMFTERDLNYAYDSRNPVAILLKDDKSKCKSDYVKIDGNVITISDEGVYVFSGSLTNGQIIVDADDTDKVQLVLNKVSINCDASAAIYAKNAHKVFITSIDNDNALSNKKDFVAIDDNNVNAVIYSKCDLTMNGSGSLKVTAAYGHGISSKDDLVLSGGSYTVNAAKHSLDANDSVRITDCTLNLDAQKDAIHSDNKDDENKGFVYIKDGTVNISCTKQGIQSSSEVKIADGKINIEKSGEGIEGKMINIAGGDISVTADDDGFNATDSSDNSDNQAPQGKGGGFGNVQSDCMINISSGSVYINAGGDGLDSNGSINITGGTITVFGSENDGNSAIDYDGKANISGGTVVAIGMSGMAEGFDDTSSQCSILYNTDSINDADTKIELLSRDGTVLAQATAVKKFNSIVISTPDIESGKKYTLNIGSQSEKIKMRGTVYSNGKSAFGGAKNGRPDGGKPNDGNIPDDNRQGDGMQRGEKPDDLPNGERPDLPNGEKPADLPDGEPKNMPS